MKKIKMVMLYLMPVMALNTTTAQESGVCNTNEIGIKFLPAFSSFKMKTANGETTAGTTMYGYGAGISFGRNFNNHAGADVEVLYNSFSKKYNDNGLERKVNIRYVNVPLLLRLSSNKIYPVNFNVVAGPQLGFNAGSNTTFSGTSHNDSLTASFSIKNVAFDFAYGAGLDFSFSQSQAVHVGIGFRGTYGITTINNRETPEVSNKYSVLNNENVKTYSGYVALVFSF